MNKVFSTNIYIIAFYHFTSVDFMDIAAYTRAQNWNCTGSYHAKQSYREVIELYCFLEDAWVEGIMRLKAYIRAPKMLLIRCYKHTIYLKMQVY